MKKIHVLLHDDLNIDNFPTNTLYVGEVSPNGAEYICIKDEFGDSINLRDEQTTAIENFTKNFMEVSTKVNWNENPKILFQISDAGSKKEVLNDLYNKLKNTCTDLKPMKEILQVDGNRYEFTPFISVHGTFITMKLNGADDTTVSESVRTLLTEVWKSYDSVLTILWELYKNLADLLSTLSLKTAQQFKRIVKIDMGIIETKIRIDRLLFDINDTSWVERKWIKEIVDLRSNSTNRLYQLIVNSVNSGSACIGKWMIVQDASIDNTKNMIGVAIIEVCGNNKVIDFKFSNSGTSGIKIMPSSSGEEFPIIALHGGARYHIFRTPQGTGSLNTNLVDVTTLMNSYINLNAISGHTTLMADDYRIGGDGLYLREHGGTSFFKISLI